MTSNRRQFLRVSGLVATGALAGCSGQDQGGQSGTTETHTSTATETAPTTGTETETETTEGEEGGGEQAAYTWMDATWDSYWYSLYNMSANISMSANGVLFPHNEEQQAAFENRFPKMLQAANRKRPPIENANLNMAAFTDADPRFTQQPAFRFGSGGKRPNASTLA